MFRNATVSEYSQVFTEGQLSFTARKGGRNLQAQTFQITQSSTVQDLMSVHAQSMGIQTDGDDSQNPIPGSLKTIPGETGTLRPELISATDRFALSATTVKTTRSIST